MHSQMRRKSCGADSPAPYMPERFLWQFVAAFASHPERPLRALREQGFDRHRFRDQSLLVHVAHERLERVPIVLKPVWPEVLARQVHGLVGVLDQER
jgi:hypothetical protein